MKIAKKCYEQFFGNQKYEQSNLNNTYSEVVEMIIKEAKKEVIGEIKKYFNETIKKDKKMSGVFNWKIQTDMFIDELEKRHLSPSAEESYNKDFTATPKACPKCKSENLHMANEEGIVYCEDCRYVGKPS